MSKITTDMIVPYLDVNKDKTFAKNDWVAIDLSTIFELGMNPETEEKKYISMKNPKTIVQSNAIAMDQEIEMESTNPMYSFIKNLFYKRPVGSECDIPALIKFEDNSGWRSIATIILGSMNTNDGIITFTINYNDVTEGTVAIAQDGTVTFTPSNS